MSSYLSKEDLQLLEEMKMARDERRRLSEIAQHLNLPCMAVSATSYGDSEPYIKMKDLWEVLSDEKKLKQFLSRLNNKAFW